MTRYAITFLAGLLAACSPEIRGDGFYGCANGECPDEQPFCWSDQLCHGSAEPGDDDDDDDDDQVDAGDDDDDDDDDDNVEGRPCTSNAMCGALLCVEGDWPRGMETKECHREEVAYGPDYAQPCSGAGDCAAPFRCIEGAPGRSACMRPCPGMGILGCLTAGSSRAEHCAPSRMGTLPVACVVNCTGPGDDICPSGTTCVCPPGSTVMCDCVATAWAP